MTEILAGTQNKFLDALRGEVLAVAAAFSSDAHPLGEMLAAMVDDVARASREPLEIFPVCHHSPASALHLLKRLRERPVRVIFMEMCEDLQAALENLRSCRLPVALQAFAPSSEVFPAAWSPLSVVAPITEFSAEYQAIAYAMGNPDVEIVFVDRSVDHIFQWMPKDDEELERRVAHDEDDDDDQSAAATTPSGDPEPKKASHGSAIGVQVGNMEPTFDAFLSFLLKNARVRHFAEWWDQYVEQAVLGADYETYRNVMFLVGSLLRRLGRREDDRKEDRLRERYMWTRMKKHLRAKQIAPKDAIYICGAAHAASEVEEFGTLTSATWAIPERTNTKWLYGVIPSSFAAIEHQFGNPAGTVSMCESTWTKALGAMGLTPLRIAKEAPLTSKSLPKKPPKKAAAAGAGAAGSVQAGAGSAASASPAPAAGAQTTAAEPAASESPSLFTFLTKPPSLTACDEEELLHWCVNIVALARENGYLTSTADSIAIYQTALLLANLRNRNHPSPYDFQDAAITCLEKDRTPKKRNIQRLCEILLGGDRVGMVGYASLPPLAQDVYDRLRPLGLNLTSTTVQRALIDFKKNPELLPVSDLLWRIQYLSPYLAKPTMGHRTLGGTPIQESWDIYIGKYQSSLIQLGYEGVSVEGVIEKRLKAKAFGPKATTVEALEATERSLLYLKSPRLTGELGERAIELLTKETGAQDAPDVFKCVRGLVHYYRSTPHGLPEWLKRFVTTGYSHYATLLPTSFQDRGTKPEEVAGMLAFLFTLESLALSFGCQRSQLLIAVGQAAPVTDDPAKIGLLWSAEWLLKLRDISQIRAFLDSVLGNVLLLPTFPAYVSGFLLALGFTPLVGRLVVEFLSKSFERLPDDVLMPWMPSLIMALRPLGPDLVGTLVKEAQSSFPARVVALDGWRAPWDADEAAIAEAAADAGAAADADADAGTATEAGAGAAAAPSLGVDLKPEEAAARALLVAHPTSANALGALFGEAPTWTDLAAAAGAGSAPSGSAEAQASAVGASASAAAPGTSKGPGAAAPPSPSAKLIEAYPVALQAMAALLGSGT
jgi:hypothetical protein